MTAPRVLWLVIAAALAASAQRLPGRPRTPARPGASRPAAPAAATAIPLNATVEERLLGPSSGKMWLSDDGEHVAISALNGSRAVMVVDGVESPPFDEVGDASDNIQSVWFSPDGKRCAYVARRGADLFAVVNGKETRIARTGSVGLDAIFGIVGRLEHPGNVRLPDNWFFHFNRDGSHLAFMLLTPDGAQHLVVDGATGPTFAVIDPNEIAWGGNRLGFVAETKDKSLHAVVDGKAGPAFRSVKWLRMTPDGAHYVYVANNTLMVDGVSQGPLEAATVGVPYLLAPDGRVSYMKPGGNPPVVVVDAKEIPGAVPLSVVFKADGKGFAYVKATAAGGKVAVIDGQAGQEYGQITELQYSRSGRAAYVAQKAGLWFPVIDGVEGPGRNRVEEFRFSDDGKRYAYWTYVSAGPGAGFSVVVDGNASPLYRSIEDQALAFSPDSRHYAYVAGTGYLQFHLVVDGTDTALSGFGKFAARRPIVALPFPRLLFSPDARHLAYEGALAGGRGGVIVDGQVWPPSPSYEFPMFSPDSRHFAVMAWAQGRITAVVDGKTGPTYDDIPEVSMSVCRFIDNRTLRFLGVKQGHVYRVLVKLAD